MAAWIRARGAGNAAARPPGLAPRGPIPSRARDAGGCGWGRLAAAGTGGVRTYLAGLAAGGRRDLVQT